MIDDDRDEAVPIRLEKDGVPDGHCGACYRPAIMVLIVGRGRGDFQLQACEYHGRMLLDGLVSLAEAIVLN